MTSFISGVICMYAGTGILVMWAHSFTDEYSELCEEFTLPWRLALLAVVGVVWPIKLVQDYLDMREEDTST